MSLLDAVTLQPTGANGVWAGWKNSVGGGVVQQRLAAMVIPQTVFKNMQVHVLEVLGLNEGDAFEIRYTAENTYCLYIGDEYGEEVVIEGGQEGELACVREGDLTAYVAVKIEEEAEFGDVGERAFFEVGLRRQDIFTRVVDATTENVEDRCIVLSVSNTVSSCSIANTIDAEGLGAVVTFTGGGGQGTVTISGELSGGAIPKAGYLAVVDSDYQILEVLYYSAYSDNVFSISSAEHRGLFGYVQSGDYSAYAARVLATAIQFNIVELADGENPSVEVPSVDWGLAMAGISLTAGVRYAVWLRRVVLAGARGIVGADGGVYVMYTVAKEQAAKVLVSRTCVTNANEVGYNLYRKNSLYTGVETLVATFNTLPTVVTATLPGYFSLRRVNVFGVESMNKEFYNLAWYTGGEIKLANPYGLVLTDVGSGKIRAFAKYDGFADNPRGDMWEVTISNFNNVGGSGFTSRTVLVPFKRDNYLMRKVGVLDYIIEGNMRGDELVVSARVKNTELSRYSNAFVTKAITCVSSASPERGVVGISAVGNAFSSAALTWSGELSWSDGDVTVTWGVGYTTVAYEGRIIWKLWSVGDTEPNISGVYTVFGKNQVEELTHQEEEGLDTFVVISQDIVGIRVSIYPAVIADFTSMQLNMLRFIDDLDSQGDGIPVGYTVPDMAAFTPVKHMAGCTMFYVVDAVTLTARIGLVIISDGTIRVGLPWRQVAEEIEIP